MTGNLYPRVASRFFKIVSTNERASKYNKTLHRMYLTIEQILNLRRLVCGTVGDAWESFLALQHCPAPIGLAPVCFRGKNPELR